MTGNITVVIGGGTYRLSQPLTFTPKDSGTNGYTVVWTAAPKARVVISGADRISGWQRHDSSQNIWEARVPRNLRSRQVYVNGMRASPAIGPAPKDMGETWTGYDDLTLTMSHWRNPKSIDFVYTAQLGQMSEPICPVQSIKGANITMAEPCWDNSSRRPRNYVGYGSLGSPTYIENAYELMDQPGQYYLDTGLHVLYYIPRRGENMHTADVEVPALQSLISGSGVGEERIHNLSFDNLQFSYATWMQPSSPQGFSEVQANYTITGNDGYATEGLCHFARDGTCPFGAWTKEPGNVQFSYDSNLTFLNDRFVHLGAAGLNLDNGSQDDTIAGCVFTDISGNGVEIGNVNMPNATGGSQTANVRVEGNHLYGIPEEYHGGVSILVGYAANSTISHNQIDHIPYGGISMGWGGWPDKARRPAVANYSHGNVVSDNLIFDFLQVLADGGAVYTQGVTGSSMDTGQQVTGNVIYGLLEWGEALHSDNGATYVTYSHNVLYDNDYDWSGNHFDYLNDPGDRHPHQYDPQQVIDNYWQQGDPHYARRHVLETGNHIISGPGQAPLSIRNAAGIEPQFRSILRWRPSGDSVPNAPELVSALFAARGKAFVTWQPSYAAGNFPVSSYIVRACPVTRDPIQRVCSGSNISSVTISAADFDRLGYAVVRGLRTDRRYSFVVVATSKAGWSMPSIPSASAAPNRIGPGLPGKPSWGALRPGRGDAGITWIAPKHDGGVPVLAYRLTLSTGQSYAFTGHSQLILTNRGGYETRVIGGLIPGHSYWFAVSAVTPGGVGPPAKSHAVRPS